jgi:flagellar assembly protein FliH
MSASRSGPKFVNRRANQSACGGSRHSSTSSTSSADARQAWLRHWERSAIGLSARIAERTIRRELARDPEIRLGLIQEALELAAGSPRLKIMLNPDDFRSLGGRAKALASRLAAAATTEIVPDESISAGGCRVETAHGAIDEQIETRLMRIVSELTDDGT